ncbi:hypothetical protein EHQ68_10910 [Leptospira congkakensis]|uniref:Uncharacterized protein n=1 Tax=Leptospira congkakensis TaxID=2484932 RepID=A0A4Z1AIQ7_9LEPT|nr:hypothetical protein [Leptospira congkakensis]TGL88322.1 hypothetical protein EHQ68_10910 [Leptospira congkakensis]TGL95428.1 hypothetical protein EHQ69_03095 [Leptospira congkakensis]TGL96509.1 hypothetical protein EHQ70_10145 [Leptospira congkakensis]
MESWLKSFTFSAMAKVAADFVLEKLERWKESSTCDSEEEFSWSANSLSSETTTSKTNPSRSSMGVRSSSLGMMTGRSASSAKRPEAGKIKKTVSKAKRVTFCNFCASFFIFLGKTIGLSSVFTEIREK